MLATALSVEACGTACEPFQWLTDEQAADLPPETRAAVEPEIADVLLQPGTTRRTGRARTSSRPRSPRWRGMLEKSPVAKASGSRRKYDAS